MDSEGGGYGLDHGHDLQGAFGGLSMRAARAISARSASMSRGSSFTARSYSE
jgi:hypothetical protein